MESVSLIILWLLILCGVVNLVVECKRDLMMFQQNSYREERYRRWLSVSGETTSMVRIVTMVALMIMLIPSCPVWFGALIAIVPLCINTLKLLRAEYKKPLVWTNRAKRIYIVMMALAILVLVTACVIGRERACGIVIVALFDASHLLIIVSGWLLKPIESYINKRYYNDAARILSSMPGLKVVGVTGSYGKTSTKHYLNRILSEKYNVLMTPGSYNTTMGVIRTVREMMQPYNEVFICEMGAKNVGDIKEICDLVHPSIGIVTAVGEQHLESFKSIENVQRTKFELVDALPAEGLAVVNDDFEYGASRVVDNVAVCRYAVNATDNADFMVKDVVYDETGTTFTIVGKGEDLVLHTKLLGECNISNLMAAVIVALHLGVSRDEIRYAVSKIEQVEHRLNLKRTPAGVTIIDDAFNSNPTGSKMAVDVLASMKTGKRIVVTPGMIELGDKQYQYNYELGNHIAKCVDVAIVVGEYNREALVAGIRDGGMSGDCIKVVDTFREAQSVVSQIVVAGDTVLYENDLPDTFK